MNRLGILAYGVAIASIVLLTAREVIEPSAYLYDGHTSAMVALGGAGWFVATLGPLAMSLWFWRLARGLKSQWVWHFLFIPCAIAIYRAGASILFYAADVPDGDSIEGYTLLTGFGFLLFTLQVHAVALVAQGAARVRANVR
jgi:hypothetical protein